MPKVGDKVKVVFEGVVTGDAFGVATEVDGYDIPPRAEVTLLPPDEPDGIGAVARVTLSSGESYVSVRNAAREWFSRENGWESWEELLIFGVEILSEGYKLPSEEK